MTTDTQLTELIINTLSPEQMPAQPSDTEIYLVEDDVEYASVDELNQGLATKQDVITDLGDIRNNIATNTSNISYLDEKVRDIELFKFPNAVIIGEPTIQNGQVSNFSTMSYLQFPFILDLHNQAFQIDFSFTTATNVQTQQNILDSNFGLALAIQNGKGVMAISSNGTSWDIGSTTGTMTIQSNTTYYARLLWNKLQYKTQLSTDGVNYTDDMVITDTRSPYPRTMFIGGCDQLETGHAPHPFLGTINMNKASLSIMGNVIWQGMDDAGLSTRADLSLSNLDGLGEKRFTDLQDAINTKANNSDLTAHTSNGTIHVTASDKIAWSQKQNTSDNDLTTTNKTVVGAINELNSSKQATISDLETIREGASKGATALQSVPSNYVTDTQLATKQNKLTAGDNITIENDVISVAGIAEQLTNKVDVDSSWGFPSNRYVGLSLGVSGTRYTAPANGYVYLSLLSGGVSANNPATLHLQAGGLRSIAQTPTSNQGMAVYVPVRKGCEFLVFYNNVTSSSSTDNLRFIYAEGSN